jgi:5-methylthioribose kinase
VDAFLRASGLISTGQEASLTPLTGGVASDIWRVEVDNRVFVVKRALPRLRVAQVWDVPTSRNASEAEWMDDAVHAVPGCAPRVLARDVNAGIFAMSYLDPREYPVWKGELQNGRADPRFAAQVGRTMAEIHAATADSEEIARRYANDATFQSIRIEPYFEATACSHPGLVEPLLRLSRETLGNKRVLVHGDVSPKNVLVGPRGPVFLDAECAWYGEPAFDLAFCLNHLLLKCLWRPAAQHRLLACFDALAASYLAVVNWESACALEQRAARRDRLGPLRPRRRRSGPGRPVDD